MIAGKPRHLDLRQPDGALRETTIHSNCSGAIVALPAEKVNRNPTGRSTERGMALKSARHGKSAILEAQAALSPALGAWFNGWVHRAAAEQARL